MRPGKKNPAGGNLRDSVAISAMRALYGKPETTRARYRLQSPSIPPNWRARLPDPATYYPAHVAKLTGAKGGGWAQGRCPFHDDRQASLSVNLVNAHGGWRCFAGCGRGDLVSFHIKRTGLAFKDAVRDLIGVRA